MLRCRSGCDAETGGPIDCKRLTPTYEAVARTFSRDPSVVIAKVDCEHEASKAVARAQGIQGFPTVKFFPRGQPASAGGVVYASARDEASFVAFVNEHAGTHRAVGGGLDQRAGRVPALDALLRTDGWTLDELREAVKAVEGGEAEQKAAQYYLRVAEKQAGSPAYVEKEAARLRKIVETGGVSAEKLDELTVRRNILRSFVPAEEGAEEETEEEKDAAKDEL
ncbi:Protein disulfide-isomerase-like 2-2 [Ascosphaera acerosa]|nr:Protein disulfide-isomerase-like 2-2 [Ascosphaera acerosa]